MFQPVGLLPLESGTDGGLTTDHKPDNKVCDRTASKKSDIIRHSSKQVEEERIARTGGTVIRLSGALDLYCKHVFTWQNTKVQTVMGVARVNGDLAVSRAFGDAQHKQTGGRRRTSHTARFCGCGRCLIVLARDMVFRRRTIPSPCRPRSGRAWFAMPLYPSTKLTIGTCLRLSLNSRR